MVGGIGQSRTVLRALARVAQDGGRVQLMGEGAAPELTVWEMGAIQG